MEKEELENICAKDDRFCTILDEIKRKEIHMDFVYQQLKKLKKQLDVRVDELQR